MFLLLLFELKNNDFVTETQLDVSCEDCITPCKAFLSTSDFLLLTGILPEGKKRK